MVSVGFEPTSHNTFLHTYLNLLCFSVASLNLILLAEDVCFITVSCFILLLVIWVPAVCSFPTLAEFPPFHFPSSIWTHIVDLLTSPGRGCRRLLYRRGGRDLSLGGREARAAAVMAGCTIRHRGDIGTGGGVVGGIAVGFCWSVIVHMRVSMRGRRRSSHSCRLHRRPRPSILRRPYCPECHH